MKQLKGALAILIGTTVLTKAPLASDAIGPGDSDSRWILGASAFALNNVYVGEDALLLAAPRLTYNGEHLFLKEGSLNLSFGEQGSFGGGLTLNLDNSFLSDEDEYEDTRELAGLFERDATVEGGFYINHTTDMGRLKLTVVTDLDDKHEGHTASLKYTFDMLAGGWYINPVVGMHWLSNNKVNHHYGVSEAEALPGRAAYQAGSALNLFAGLRARYEFTEHWDISLQSALTYLDSDIRDSSIVDDDYVFQVGATLSYNF